MDSQNAVEDGGKGIFCGLKCLICRLKVHKSGYFAVLPRKNGQNR
jgi:hypothetical protein